MINHELIYNLLEEAKNATKEDIREILNRAKNKQGLSHRDIAILLQTEDEDDLKEIFKIAGEIKILYFF